ncbi:MAG TPA: acetoacetate decarboxylase family protein [Archangium sp.]|nr:acetoacetate decarboxylase family protein [Archangium sp.]
MAYMSPEQWGNGVAIDHRTDIWAVGIMRFRMLAAQHPLGSRGGPQRAVTALLDEPMPRLREVLPDAPPELAAIVDRCLLKHKEERFPDALSLLRALEPFLHGRYNREQRIDESPYAGLSSFFGRTRELAALVNRIHDRPLLAVVGPSGTGKSSFVRAGLVPVLKRSGTPWEALVIRPGRNPLSALANMMAPLVSSSDSVEQDLKEQKLLIEHLRNEPGYVGNVPEQPGSVHHLRGTTMDIQPSSSPHASPINYPPAPWKLRGQVYMSTWSVPVHRCSLRVDPVFEPLVGAGRMFVTGAFVEYEPGSTLTYGELAMGIVVKQRGALRYGAATPLIWVDSEQSLRGGRALWNLPKEMAHFELDRRPPGGGFSGAAWDERGRLLGKARFALLPGLPRRVRLPFLLPDLYSIRGQVCETKDAFSSSLRLLRGSWSVPDSSPLAALGLAGQRPRRSFWMRDVALTLPAATPVADR